MDCDETENRFLLTCIVEYSKGYAFMASWKVVAKFFLHNLHNSGI